jgi:hypothetical protein
MYHAGYDFRFFFYFLRDTQKKNSYAFDLLLYPVAQQFEKSPPPNLKIRF